MENFKDMLLGISVLCFFFFFIIILLCPLDLKLCTCILRSLSFYSSVLWNLKVLYMLALISADHGEAIYQKEPAYYSLYQSTMNKLLYLE